MVQLLSIRSREDENDLVELQLTGKQHRLSADKLTTAFQGLTQ